MAVDAALGALIGGLRAAYGAPRVWYTPAGELEIEALEAFFDASGTRIELAGGVPAEAVAPRLLWRAGSQGVTPREGDTFRVEGAATYSVVAVDEDGRGGVELTAREIAS